MNRAVAILLAGATVGLAVAGVSYLGGRRSPRVGHLRPASRHGTAEATASYGTDPSMDARLDQLGSFLGRVGPAWSSPAPAEPEVVTPRLPPMPAVWNEALGRPVVDYPAMIERVRDELLPLVWQCYRASLERDPESRGRLYLRYTIIGNANVGGVVEDAELVPRGTTLKDPELRACIVESMKSVTFGEPPDEHEVVGSYSMALTPESLPAEPAPQG